MDHMTDPDRDAIVTLLDGAIRAEARADAPLEAEKRDWLYGSVEPTEFTEPDEHGWMAIVPAKTEGWVPRTLVAWRTMLASGRDVHPDQMGQPGYSLARWPAIEVAVRDYLSEAPSCAK